MGGVWQALAFGFAGVRPRGNVLEVDPRLPEEWRALELKLSFRGSPIRLRIDHDGVTADADRLVPIEIRDRRRGPGMTKVIAALDNSLAARPVVAAGDGAGAAPRIGGRSAARRRERQRRRRQRGRRGRPGAPHVRRPDCGAPRRGRLGRRRRGAGRRLARHAGPSPPGRSDGARGARRASETVARRPARARSETAPQAPRPARRDRFRPRPRPRGSSSLRTASSSTSSSSTCTTRPRSPSSTTSVSTRRETGPGSSLPGTVPGAWVTYGSKPASAGATRRSSVRRRSSKPT